MKYEFGSGEWLAALHGIIAERVATASAGKPLLAMSTCEVFYNAPPHLADADGKITWSCVVKGPEVDFQRREIDGIGYKVLCDYEAVLPMARYDTQGDPDRAAEMQAMIRELLASGKMSRPLGDRVKDDNSVAPLHDAIARLTL